MVNNYVTRPLHSARRKPEAPQKVKTGAVKPVKTGKTQKGAAGRERLWESVAPVKALREVVLDDDFNPSVASCT